MSSRRLPGKVLKLLHEQTILGHVAERCSYVVGRENVLIATSDEVDDVPVVEFAKTHGFPYYRGSLEDVYSRFVGAISKKKVDYFVRVCADSPFLDFTLIDVALKYYKEYNVDLVTNVFPRTYPKGQSVEVIRKSAFLNPIYKKLHGFSNEHVTQGFYHHADKYNILNFCCPTSHKQVNLSWAIDTADDLQTIRNWLLDHPEGPSPFGVGKIILHTKNDINA